jgi:hypothetical protein
MLMVPPAIFFRCTGARRSFRVFDLSVPAGGVVGSVLMMNHRAPGRFAQQEATNKRRLKF